MRGYLSRTVGQEELGCTSAHRLLYHSTLGSRAIKKKQKDCTSAVWPRRWRCTLPKGFHELSRLDQVSMKIVEISVNALPPIRSSSIFKYKWKMYEVECAGGTSAVWPRLWRCAPDASRINWRPSILKWPVSRGVGPSTRSWLAVEATQQFLNAIYGKTCAVKATHPF